VPPDDIAQPSHRVAEAPESRALPPGSAVVSPRASGLRQQRRS
jgi:hypothetical protein